MTAEQKKEMFANRLRKNIRHLRKWAARQSVSCYRVYDNDMPEFPLSIDRYEEIVHVAEYAREHGMDPDAHAAWLESCLGVISDVLEAPSERIFLKFRQRQKGLQQYERFNRVGAEYIVRENNLQFIINPADFLDTGLFLDHRISRKMVQDLSADKRVLNLFAYTGAFSVYAAAGGARTTTTVDMSNTYLEWAGKNLNLNGFNGPEHRLLQADVLQWLDTPTTERWDLTILDPPTFSNSKRMKGVLDIQRDHVWLLNQTLRRMTPGGILFFSTNFRQFKLDRAGIQAADIRDLSTQTVPEDFRNKKIHQSFWVQAR